MGAASALLLGVPQMVSTKGCSRVYPWRSLQWVLPVHSPDQIADLAIDSRAAITPGGRSSNPGV